MTLFSVVAVRKKVVLSSRIRKTSYKRSFLMSKVNLCLNLSCNCLCIQRNSVFLTWSVHLMPLRWFSVLNHPLSGNLWRLHYSIMNKLSMSSQCAGTVKTQLSHLVLLLHNFHRQISKNKWKRSNLNELSKMMLNAESKLLLLWLSSTFNLVGTKRVLQWQKKKCL